MTDEHELSIKSIALAIVVAASIAAAGLLSIVFAFTWALYECRKLAGV